MPQIKEEGLNAGLGVEKGYWVKWELIRGAKKFFWSKRKNYIHVSKVGKQLGGGENQEKAKWM